MELIVGHNGLERISLGGSSNQGTGGMGGRKEMVKEPCGTEMVTAMVQKYSLLII